MKAAFIIATLIATGNAFSAPANIIIQTNGEPIKRIETFAAKELQWLSSSIGNENATIKISDGRFNGVYYVSVEVPEKKLAYTYNSAAGAVIDKSKIMQHIKEGILSITERIDD